MSTYLVDSNVFIQAKNLHYGFDFCPAFWRWLVEQSSAGKVKSIEKVANELQAGDDDLASWIRARGWEFQHRTKITRSSHQLNNGLKPLVLSGREIKAKEFASPRGKAVSLLSAISAISERFHAGPTLAEIKGAS